MRVALLYHGRVVRWIGLAVVVLASWLAIPADANACSPLPTSYLEVSFRGTEKIGLLVHCDCSPESLSVAVIAYPSRLAVSGNAVTRVVQDGVYVVWTPEEPLTEAEYLLEVAIASGDASRVLEGGFRAEPIALGGPFDQFNARLGTLVTDEGTVACCYDHISDSCGYPSVCVAERERTRATIGFARYRANPRYLYRVTGDDFVVRPRDIIFGIEETRFCASVTALDILDESTVEQEFCFDSNPSVVYGVEPIDPFSIEYPRDSCFGPPTRRDCSEQRAQDPSSCLAATDELNEAWCRYNEDCAGRPQASGCLHYEFYCGEGDTGTDGENDSGTDADDTGGCRAGGGQSTAWLLTIALALLCLRRRRRS